MYKRHLLSKAVSLSILASISATAFSAEEKKDKYAPQAMENVIVIGEKTERSLKETTSSVSVITEENLNNMQHLSITDAVSNISNVVVLSGATPDIRGVSGNGSATGFNSFSGGAKTRVSTLIDGVTEPFVADLTGDTGLWDLEQIEVFRGPQSTSNGRNSIAGSVYIKTKDPSFDWQGAARVGFRNQDGYVDTAGMISGPIVEDTLAFRITAQQLTGDTISNAKEYEDNPADFDLNELETQRLKGKLLWTPTEKLKTLLTVSTNSEEGNTGRIYYTLSGADDYEPYFYRDMDTESTTTSLKVDYQISDDISIEVLAAYMDYQWGFDTYEETATGEQHVRMDEQNTTIDAKLNFGLTSETLHGFIGFAHFEREQDFYSTGSTIYNGDDESTSTAVYGEITYALSDRLNLISGLRVENEEQNRDFDFFNGRIVAGLDTDETITLPKIALQYDLTEDTVMSASVRKGYNAAGGALNFSASDYYYYDEETVNTYELAVRSSLANGTVSLSGNLFFNDYSGYQALSSSRAIVNMDDVESYGVEVEAVAMLTPQLELRAGLGLLETEIKNAGADYEDANDNELNSAPNVTASLGTKYWFSEALSVGLSANYVGEYYGDFTNTEERVAGGYSLARVNLNYDMENWSIATFVNNALNKEEYLTVEPVSGPIPEGYVAITDPRNIGISATYRF
ncbi:TonB-dependent receptor [Microbulbifer sp. OS29]|uniref:TonB-dependent receptor n=1 Tax=Microbulbifer okhotskensis TaxID=2926617 RepID=A0A9X2ES33_9GAMM|nr:TonB-dependent receptor [Microbulbifer okhotskensis]MCO1336365.1 TonB-dependent receptor [Microbulbifer okhotskensis]